MSEPTKRIERAFPLSSLPSDLREDSERLALEFLQKALRLRGARIDREQFLRTQLKQAGIDDADITVAIEQGTIAAGIPQSVLDEIARSSINLETNKSTALSIAAGFGGLPAMAATLPADVLQYYVHAFRIMQKLAYTYGWKDFMKDADEVTDEVLAQFLVFLGVMMGVGGAANALRSFAGKVAGPAIGKKVAASALTKTAWYPIIKKVLAQVGVKITKGSVGKAVTKSVPVFGGVVGGSMTYVALRGESKRLQKTLCDIPAP